jgi:ATP-binding cassette, subfamily B, bacterial PglK
MKKYLIEILFLTGGHKKKIPLIMVIFLLGSLLDVIGLSLIAPYISLIINPEVALNSTIYTLIELVWIAPSVNQLLVIIGIFIVFLFLIKVFFTIFINWFILKFSYDRGAQLRIDLMTSYQKLEYNDYLYRNSSEYIHSIQILASRFSQSVMPIMFKFVAEGFVAIAILAFLAWTDIYALIIITVLTVGFIWLYDRIFKKKIYQYGRLVNQHQTRLVQVVSESMKGFKEIRVLGKEKYFNDVVLEKANLYSTMFTKAQTLSIAPRYILEYILILFIVVMVLISIYMGSNMQVLASTLSVFAVAALRLIPVANAFSSGISQLRFGRNTTALLYADLINVSEDKVHTTTLINDNTKIFNSFELKSVDFSYLNSDTGAAVKVLNDISISINSGESIGLIGATGSGKSTLINVMLGLLRPTSGSIYVNDLPLGDNMQILMQNSVYIPQNIFLIDDTLRRNIALGVDDDDIDDNKIRRVLSQVTLKEFVEKLPDRLNTFVGEGGVLLSGGQCQRVALARALYHERSVLFMDESTSALDNETEMEIIRQIKKLKRKKTMIIIAHRLTTLQHCDRIYRLDEGRIVEQGTYEEVIKNVNI